MEKYMIYFVCVGISLCLFIYDWIMKLAANDDTFVKLEKSGETVKSTFYVVMMNAISYWGVYGIAHSARGILYLGLVCLIGLQFFLIEFILFKRGIKAFCVVPLAVIAFAETYFMYRIGVAQIPEKMLIFTLVMAGLTVFLVFSYSATKSKVSVFRLGNVLTFICCLLSAVLLGIIASFVIESCVLSVPSLFQ